MKYTTLILLSFTIFLMSCHPQEKKKITIFYTADEHGWFNENSNADGAAALMEYWKEKEQYQKEDDSYLVLSGGDMWSGASYSTWFNGASMVDVMNEMGYDLGALGNHEFDFSVDTLIQRAKEANFPVLAANIVDSRDNTIPSFVKPYTVIDAEGLKIGIIGLANVITPNTTNPLHVKYYDFLPYEECVRRFFPEVKNAGADIVIIVGHICREEMESLVPLAVELGIPIITGGHCHESVMELKEGVLMIESYPKMTSFIEVRFDVNMDGSDLTFTDLEIHDNRYNKRDDAVLAITEKWTDRCEAIFSEKIGYSATKIKRRTKDMQTIVLDSWFQFFPEADIAIVNTGGIRTDIEAGPITVETILSLLPFNNQIVSLTIKGKELKKFIKNTDKMYEGYLISYAHPMVTIEDDKEYILLTSDYLYAQEENGFKKLDPNGVVKEQVYRDPTMQWIKSLQTSKESPIQQFLK